MHKSIFAVLCSTMLLLAACESTPSSTANPDVTSSDTAGELGATDAAADTATDAATTDTANADSAAQDATGNDSAVLDSTGQDTAGADASDAAADAVADTAADTVADTVADAVADVAPDVPSDTAGCKWDLTDSSPATLDWSTFTISKGAGPCPPDMVCSWSWTLDASGNIAKSMAGVASQAKMDAAEFGGLKYFIGNPIFTNQMANGFTCPPPPTDVGISFTLKWQGKEDSQNVTGCIFASGCNDAKSVYDLVTKY
ncbi:MAG: hypothetical protein HY902_14330 [Deltaproteobacteria bacterium]|nr:hypothetical protein [Deltaproteobacteria bacterium]